MKLWLLVPVKPFGEGKSRLADVLSADARAALSQELLARVLRSAQESSVLAGVLVVSRDANALIYAQQAGVQIVHETGHDLNAALTQASQHAVKFGADATLVLPADLPLITAEDVRQLATLGETASGIIITRSPDGGTNALLMRPPGVIEFAFGPDSFKRHRQLAQMAGIPWQVFASPTLAFDVDWPEDLQSLQRLLAASV